MSWKELLANVTLKVSPIYAKSKDYPANVMRKIRDNVRDYLRNEGGPMIVGDMDDTVENWNHKPTFVAQYSEPYGGRQLQSKIYPTGIHAEQWGWVHEGTPTRTIKAKNAPMLRFREGYTPKTTPAGKYGGPGSRYGPMRSAKSVQHSIAPRNFSTHIKNKREKRVYNDLVKVIKNTKV